MCSLGFVFGMGGKAGGHCSLHARMLLGERASYVGSSH